MDALSVPRVSVVMPAYNAGSTIEAATDSILRQTFRDFELVVVDDGSTDATAAVLDSFASRDPRLRVIHTPNRGIISALNTGIGECRGELIARMDADDISHPRRIEMQVALMDERPDISVCSCLVRMFPRKELLGGLVRYEQWLNSLVTPEQIARDMFVESPVAHPSVMLRREELLQLACSAPSTGSGCSAYQEHGWAEDYDLWLRYHVAGKRFAKVEKTLLCWRQSAGRLTFTDSRYSVENFLRAKAHYISRQLSAISRQQTGEEIAPSPPPRKGGEKDSTQPRFRGPQATPKAGASGMARLVVLWGAGKTGRRLLKHLLREGVDVQAIVDIDPAKIGHTMRGRPIVGVEWLSSGFGIWTDEDGGAAEHRNPETSGVRPFVISAVSSHGARELIREQLREIGYVEMRDFVCAA